MIRFTYLVHQGFDSKKEITIVAQNQEDALEGVTNLALQIFKMNAPGITLVKVEQINDYIPLIKETKKETKSGKSRKVQSTKKNIGL